MDVESRLLLYVVVLGCVVGIGAVVVRRAWTLQGHAMVLVALCAAAVAGLVRREVGGALAWPAFCAWAVASILPTLLVSSGRRVAAQRRFALASRLVAFASGLLVLPPMLRREARLYAALDAADRGDVAQCRERLEAIAAVDGGPGVDGDALVEMVTAVAARQWDDVLRAVGACTRRTPLVLGAEAQAACETGDLRRALRAEREMARLVADGTPALASVRRTVLAAGGRAEFLADAIRSGLPVADGAPGAARLALARALEATGDVAGAARAYGDAAAVARGLLRREAQDGAARCASGALRLAQPDELEVASLQDVEVACRAEHPDLSRRSLLRRAPATILLCTVTFVASVLVFVLLGRDEASLVAAGALSAPLVVHEGEWWRLATTMLLHGGAVHLLMNLASIVVIGLPYEERAGSVRTVIVYLASGIAASAASVWINWTDIGVGSSGAAMGIFGGLAALLVLRGHLFERSERRRWLVACAIVLAANAAIGWTEHRAIDNAAHAGGLVAGAVVAWLLMIGPADGAVARALRRLTAGTLLALCAVSVGAVLRDLPDWTGTTPVAAAGVRASLPSWLRVTDEGRLGAVALRRPLPFAVQLGTDADAAPDASALVARLFDDALDGPPEGWYASAEVERSRQGDLDVERRAWRSPDEDDETATFHAVIARRRGAFAVVVWADDGSATGAFRRAADGIARTLGPEDGSDAR